MKHVLFDGIKRILFVVSFAILCGICLNSAGCFEPTKGGCIPVDWKALGQGERIVWEIPNNACDYGEVIRQNFRIINERLDKCPCAAGGIMFNRRPTIQEEIIP